MTPNRPISPHLQVYRLPFTAILSISHRITGVLLTAGLLALTITLVSAALDPDAYALVQRIYVSVPGQIALWLYIQALAFHACHGLRHLIWDAGHRLEKARQFRDNVIEVLLSITLTGSLFMAAHGYVPAFAGP